MVTRKQKWKQSQRTKGRSRNWDRSLPQLDFKLNSYQTLKNIPETKLEVATTIILCEEILEKVQNHRLADLFIDPVSDIDVPDYSCVIKRPISLLNISEKISQSVYQSAGEFNQDMELMFTNCQTYNKPNSLISRTANNLRSFYRKLISQYLDVFCT